MSNKAEEFDQIAREIFAPIYPFIAKQFLAESKISQGLCLDLGCGSGYLGLALAEQSDLSVYLVDNNPEMLVIAQRNIDNRQLKNQATVMLADVENIPLVNNTAQLIVSRGSVYFWQDQPQAFREIYRVMAPGGMAFIGGGFGTPELKRRIDHEMVQRNPGWPEQVRRRIGPEAAEEFRSILAETGIADFYIEQSPVSMWVVISKQ
jgi:ubiquinone/menaquinone biosynthesis C-methylase UbiE